LAVELKISWSCGLYAWLGFLHDGSEWRHDRIWLHTLGGVMLIVGLPGNEWADQVLASAAGRWLGRLSLSVYLLPSAVLAVLLAVPAGAAGPAV
jgi:peptidoglycan/LPS O-acetylase OafA/YrhL